MSGQDSQTRKDDNGIKLGDLQFEFLNAAIIDISNYVRFMDTKVGAVIAAHMLMLTGLITMREDILKYSQMLIVNSCCWRLVLCPVMLFFIVNTVRVYCVGISTLLARKGDIGGERSLWFISASQEEYPIDMYLADFNKQSAENLLEGMTKELYKLNDINRVKMRKANETLRAFRISIVSCVLLLLLLFVGSRIDEKVSIPIENVKPVVQSQSPASGNVSCDKIF